MRTCIFTILILLLPVKALAESNKFVVLTFSVKRNIDKFPWEYFWIVPFDSIQTGFSLKQDLIPFAPDTDIEGDVINEKWQCSNLSTCFIWFFKTYERNRLNSLSKRIIFKNRKLIQKIREEWAQLDACKDIRIYATPIKGEINVCKQYLLSQMYAKDYYLYYAEDTLEYWDDFWETSEAQKIISTNYSHIEYDLGVD